MTTDPAAVSTQPEPAKSMTPDQAMDKVFATETAPETPAPVTEPETPAEPQPADAPGSPAEPADTSITPTEPEPGDPFVPEEEHLLKRRRATADQIAYFRGLTVSQRNIALAPLRETQLELDRLFSLPRDKREAAIRQAREQQYGQDPDTGPETPQAQKPAVDPAVIKEFAEASGLDEAIVRKLAENIAGTQAQDIADFKADRQKRDQDTAVARLNSAALEARTKLTKEIPGLSQDAKYNELINHPDAMALFHVRRQQGKDEATAMYEAWKFVAPQLNLPSTAQTRLQTERQQAAKLAKNTPEPTSKGLGRGANAPGTKPKGLDAVAAALFADDAEARRSA
jgi:hypothetical protein